jgi:hypothetical protein
VLTRKSVSRVVIGPAAHFDTLVLSDRHLNIDRSAAHGTVLYILLLLDGVIYDQFDRLAAIRAIDVFAG